MLAARLRYAAPSGQHGGRIDDALTFKLDQSIGAIQNAPGCADQGCNPSPVWVAGRVAIVSGGPRPWLIPGGPQVPPARRSARPLKALRGVRVPPMDSRHKPDLHDHDRVGGSVLDVPRCGGSCRTYPERYVAV